MLKEVSLSSTLEIKKHRKSKKDIQKKHQEAYESKALHGQFHKATEEVKGNMSWNWLKKGYLKKETESTMIAAQDQALCTRNMRKSVYGENVDSTCRVRGSADETEAHIVAEYQKLAQKEYKQERHDNVAKVIHWKLCEKWGFEKSDQWYTHKPEKVLESEDARFYGISPYRPTRDWSTTDLMSLQLRKRLRNAFSSTQHAHLTFVLKRKKRKSAAITAT